VRTVNTQRAPEQITYQTVDFTNACSLGRSKVGGGKVVERQKRMSITSASMRKAHQEGEHQGRHEGSRGSARIRVGGSEGDHWTFDDQATRPAYGRF
jgi:hypothetical protein